MYNINMAVKSSEFNTEQVATLGEFSDNVRKMYIGVVPFVKQYRQKKWEDNKVVDFVKETSLRLSCLNDKAKKQDINDFIKNRRKYFNKSNI
jgi:hypothetical protein